MEPRVTSSTPEVTWARGPCAAAAARASQTPTSDAREPDADEDPTATPRGPMYPGRPAAPVRRRRPRP